MLIITSLAVAACLSCFVAAEALGTADGAGQVYSPSAVIAGLAHRPAVWLGRRVQVRAWAISTDAAAISKYCTVFRSCPNFPESRALLWDGGSQGPAAAPAGTMLPLLIGREDPLLAALREVPVLRRQVSTPQRLDAQHVKTYRVAIQSVPCILSSTQACYAALLLDAAADQPF